MTSAFEPNSHFNCLTDYTADFDNVTVDGLNRNKVSDCISEKLLSLPNGPVSIYGFARFAFFGYGDTDGADGSLDQPCELIIRGDELIIVNMDYYFESEYLKNTGIDQPYTLSVIGL